MTREELHEYCLTKLGASLEFPFDETTPVYKVAGKMFALTHLHEDPLTVNLKCDPGLARDLRTNYPAIKPGYHMNKEHWNTLTLDNSLEDAFVKGLIDHSYELVVGKKKIKRSEK